MIQLEISNCRNCPFQFKDNDMGAIRHGCSQADKKEDLPTNIYGDCTPPDWCPLKAEGPITVMIAGSVLDS